MEQLRADKAGLEAKAALEHACWWVGRLAWQLPSTGDGGCLPLPWKQGMARGTLQGGRGHHLLAAADWGVSLGVRRGFEQPGLVLFVCVMGMHRRCHCVEHRALRPAPQSDSPLKRSAG